MRNIFLLLLSLQLLASPLRSTCHGSDEPYCGLYCVHAAIQSLGVDVGDFVDLCVPEHLSGKPGSTAANLTSIAESYGLRATYAPSLGIAELRNSNSPIILHTLSPLSDNAFYHWIVFLGMEGNSALIYDPPTDRYLMSEAELLSIWDGGGVIVRKTDTAGVTDFSRFVTACDSDQLSAILFTLLPLLVISRLKTSSSHPALSLFAAAFSGGILWHLLSPYGFINNVTNLQDISRRYSQAASVVIDTTKLRELLTRNDISLVDARTETAYEQEHLPGAVNIPVTSSRHFIRNKCSEIPIRNNVIVYCQSDKCGWADSIARELRLRDYPNVSIYRQGMNGWKSEEAQSATSNNKGE